MSWWNPASGRKGCMYRQGEAAPQERPGENIRRKMRSQHDPREPDQESQREPGPGPPGIPEGQEHCRGKRGGCVPRRKRAVRILRREAGEIGEERSRLWRIRPRTTEDILQDLIQDSRPRRRRRAQQPPVSTVPVPPPPSPQRRHQEDPDIYHPVPKTGDGLPEDVQRRRAPTEKRRLKA
jgi:hypothetical protein